MHDKTKFVLFTISLVIVLIVVFQLKKIYNPVYIYAHKDLKLDYSNKKKLPEEKIAFVEQVVRGAQLSNYYIQTERKRLKKIEKYFEQNHRIPFSMKESFSVLLKKYLGKEDVKLEEDDMAKVFGELDKRVQIVPVRLTVAQAIIESAWGTSRFAKQAHAYFGIHCYSSGCGMAFGSGNTMVFVKSYDSMQASIEDYMLFLNSKRGTRKFRNARIHYLESKKHDIFKLLESLTAYSEIGGSYHKILTSLLERNIPDNIEDY